MTSTRFREKIKRNEMSISRTVLGIGYLLFARHIGLMTLYSTIKRMAETMTAASAALGM